MKLSIRKTVFLCALITPLELAYAAASQSNQTIPDINLVNYSSHSIQGAYTSGDTNCGDLKINPDDSQIIWVTSVDASKNCQWTLSLHNYLTNATDSVPITFNNNQKNGPIMNLSEADLERTYYLRITTSWNPNCHSASWDACHTYTFTDISPPVSACHDINSVTRYYNATGVTLNWTNPGNPMNTSYTVWNYDFSKQLKVFDSPTDGNNNYSFTDKSAPQAPASIKQFVYHITASCNGHNASSLGALVKVTRSPVLVCHDINSVTGNYNTAGVTLNWTNPGNPPNSKYTVWNYNYTKQLGVVFSPINGNEYSFIDKSTLQAPTSIKQFIYHITTNCNGQNASSLGTAVNVTR